MERRVVRLRGMADERVRKCGPSRLGVSEVLDVPMDVERERRKVTERLGQGRGGQKGGEGVEVECRGSSKAGERRAGVCVDIDG